MDDKNNPSVGGTTTQSPIYQESQDKNAKWLWLLIVLIIVGALVFAFFRGIGPFAQFRGGSEIASPTPESESSPISRPSPSPEAEEIDKSEPSIRVLNGTGTAGLASSVKDLLEELGWTVSSIGNADSDTYEQTELIFKEGFENFEDALSTDLSDSYSVIVGSDTLESSDSADIEIIIGSE